MQLELWLSTDYKLTEQEMEDAQSMLDEYFAPGTAAQQLRDANSAGMAGVMRNKMTDKESQKYQLMAALSNKTSTWNSLVIGVMSAIPLLDNYMDWSSEMIFKVEGKTMLDISRMEHMYANSSVQHPIASGGGGILGSLALYNAAVKVANSIPQIAKLAGSWAGSLSKLPILGKINKKHLSNILGATIVDAGVYTLPQTVKDIVDKKSVGTILGNILLDSGKNLGLNIAGEGAGALIGKVSKVASDGIRGGKNVGDLIRKSEFTNKWGILDDGTNQGVKHFSDYWEKYPERIPSLEQRLGISKGSFSNSLDGLLEYNYYWQD